MKIELIWIRFSVKIAQYFSNLNFLYASKVLLLLLFIFIIPKLILFSEKRFCISKKINQKSFLIDLHLFIIDRNSTAFKSLTITSSPSLVVTFLFIKFLQNKINFIFFLLKNLYNNNWRAVHKLKFPVYLMVRSCEEVNEAGCITHVPLSLLHLNSCALHKITLHKQASATGRKRREKRIWIVTWLNALSDSEKKDPVKNLVNDYVRDKNKIFGVCFVKQNYQFRYPSDASRLSGWKRISDWRTKAKTLRFFLSSNQGWMKKYI